MGSVVGSCSLIFRVIGELQALSSSGRVVESVHGANAPCTALFSREPLRNPLVLPTMLRAPRGSRRRESRMASNSPGFAPPRIAPEIPLPREPYLPGRGRPDEEYPLPPAPEPPPATISEDIRFRLGIDLFNHRFYYEAHEAWESIWLHLPVGDRTREQLQGLIQAAAALLKLWLEAPAPAASIWVRGRRRLEDVAREAPGGVSHGVVLPPLIAAVDAAVASGRSPETPPRITFE
jgi:hypothetical protein